MNNEGLRKGIAKMTRQIYGWTGFNNPIGFSPSKKHWESPSRNRRKFLCVNYRFKSDGTKVKIIGG